MTPDNSSSIPQFVLSHEGELHGVDSPENRELVRRLHACFRACEGISTEELEAGIVADMARLMGQVLPLLKEREALQTTLRQAS